MSDYAHLVGGIICLTAVWSECGANGNKEQRFGVSPSTHGNITL